MKQLRKDIRPFKLFPEYCGPFHTHATTARYTRGGKCTANGTASPPSTYRVEEARAKFYTPRMEKADCLPQPPPSSSREGILTPGRDWCSSFRRIQSFSNTSKLEAEYTKKGEGERDKITAVYKLGKKPDSPPPIKTFFLSKGTIALEGQSSLLSPFLASSVAQRLTTASALLSNPG